MKIAICDDNAQDRLVIKKYLNANQLFDERYDIEEFDDGTKLIDAYNCGKRFNLVLLDVQMRKMDGFDTADLIRDFDSDVMIVFITTWAEHLAKALFVEASAYIIKPVKEKNIQDVLVHAVKRINRHADSSIVIQINKQVRYIRPSELLYVSSETNRMLLYKMFNGEELRVYKKMKEAIAELVENEFICVSRSSIVNPQYINGFDKKNKSVRMIDGAEIRISAKDMEKVFEQYASYIAQKSRILITKKRNLPSDINEKS